MKFIWNYNYAIELVCLGIGDRTPSPTAYTGTDEDYYYYPNNYLDYYEYNVPEQFDSCPVDALPWPDFETNPTFNPTTEPTSEATSEEDTATTPEIIELDGTEGTIQCGQIITGYRGSHVDIHLSFVSDGDYRLVYAEGCESNHDIILSIQNVQGETIKLKDDHNVFGVPL